ncbi:MAG: NUDIX hydrolase [Paenisporosarcina sp.]|nr:NUDIX hydrolase [Paenisporosarcina sp.]
MEYYQEIRQYVGHRPLILPGAVVIIQNEFNEILLQERKPGLFGLPGGLMDLGESLEETASREVLEETGLSVSDLELCQVFSGPDYYFKIDNGDEFYSVTVVYQTKTFTGTLQANAEETLSLSFFPIDNLPHQLLASNKNFLRKCLDI